MTFAGTTCKAPLPGDLTAWPDTTKPGMVFIRSPGQNAWMEFSNPFNILQTHDTDQVMNHLREVERAVEEGYYAAGFIAYDAAPAFDRHFIVRRHSATPLIWFGLYEQAHVLKTPPARPPPPVTGDADFSLHWSPTIDRERYEQAIDRIKHYIARGDTYQVNYTMKLVSELSGHPVRLFKELCAGPQSRYGMYIDAGDFVVCSASPELFFALDDSDITCRPMKGTAPRGMTHDQDRHTASWLKQSAKNRAENVMIVDMIRNDLGRIATPGSVRVPHLFNVERYPTVFQMTSTVTARSDASLTDIIQALFPCASITGAPKIRTMEIIAEVEAAARGLYTGCMGYAGPQPPNHAGFNARRRHARFNVAIRTVTIDRTSGGAEYGIGGGIVWDSEPAEEYDECVTKALMLNTACRSFELLETMLWRPDAGYFLLEEHLERLMQSAGYFDFSLDDQVIRERLLQHADTLHGGPHRVRLLAAADGSLNVEATRLPTVFDHRRRRVALAHHPIDSRNRFLYHKTTRREIYDMVRAEFPNMDDVVLWNERGEVTEACLANIVVRIGDALITPPVSSGLLGGAYRRHLLEKERIEEGAVTLRDLVRADALYLINSVRGWLPAVLDLE